MREGAPKSHARGRGDRDVRGSIGSGSRGKNTPTLVSPRTETMRDGSRHLQGVCLVAIRRSGRECRETLGPPESPHGAQDSASRASGSFERRRRPRDESRARSRERTRYGYTQIVQVAEVGRTHRASCPPGGRKTTWRGRALARRKLEAPPDAEHESREGETVREEALTLKRTRRFGLRAQGSQAHDTTEGVLGPKPARPSPVGRSRGPTARR
jgi:hypothetical protein